MRVRNTLLFLFCVILLSGLNTMSGQAKVTPGGMYEIPKTTVVPVIDGVQDPVWKTLDWNFQTSYDNNGPEPDDWTDLFGGSKLIYDDDNLYGLFWTQDENQSGNDGVVVDWQRNGVEIYLDGDNSKLHSVAAPDHHLVFRHEYIDAEVGHLYTLESGLDTTGIEFKIRDDDRMIGYWVEFKIPLENVSVPNTPGSVIGLELQQNDNDGNGREHVSKWFMQDGDSSWQYASTWGNAILSDRIVSEEGLVMKVAAGSAPAIDGDIDPVYLAGTSFTTNNFGNISATAPVYPDDFSDAFVRLYMLYDDDNMYGIFQVYDEDPVGNDGAAVDWQRNAVEVYFDGDNSKIPGPNVTAPDHHLAFRHEYIDAEEGHLYTLETGLDTTGIVYKIKDVMDPIMGYNIEFKIPLDNISMPNTEGSVFGLEIQQNDNDGNGRDVVTKWWLNEGDSSWQFASTWGTAKLGGQISTAVDRNVPGALSYKLDQNYPNPFNPSTRITYSVAKNDHVKLTVYNMLGKEVAVLVNENQSAGEYSVNFNASGLSSGVYFYRLEAGNMTLANKMVLLK